MGFLAFPGTNHTGNVFFIPQAPHTLHLRFQHFYFRLQTIIAGLGGRDKSMNLNEKKKTKLKKKRTPPHFI